MKTLLTSSLALGVVVMLGASSPVEANDAALQYKSGDSNIVQASWRGRHHRYYYNDPYYYYGPYDRGGLCVGPLCIY